MVRLGGTRTRKRPLGCNSQLEHLGDGGEDPQEQQGDVHRKVSPSSLATWRLTAGELNFTRGAFQGSLVGPPRIRPLDMCSCRNVLGT